ncbi:hypothetical protein PMZ80_003662 [Knufia obscura]|uniref:PH domain-containing protein n=1 Tax=Knufia obscura TaxID=1635080 RepID=A0ABR0RUV4_9EURO|nr:hypothetical protein PMZ80_003662 [Knufia obscura]
MEADAMISTPAQDAKFSRYLSVRKAAARDEESAPPLPGVAPTADPNQQNKNRISRAPSRYRRPAAPRQHDVPLPATTNVALPASSHARPLTSRPKLIPEATTSADSPNVAAQPALERFNQVQPSPQHVERSTRNADPHNAARRTTRYRSRTTSTPKEDRPAPARKSYDQAREEARLILEGEYDRLHRLKQQQREQAEKDRRKRAEAKLAEQRAEQVRVEQVAADQKASTKEQQQEQKSPKQRKWTIGNESNHASPPVSAPQSPPTSQKLYPVQSPSSGKASQSGHRSRTGDTPINSPPAPAAQDVERPTLKQRIRRHTHSRPREPQAPPSFEPKSGDGPPKTATNGPVQTVDAPVSAVNAGERRVQIRFEKSKITLPVTPSTTVKDLLNSASIIMSQPIDPRTSVLVETYYPLGLERPLRRYEHIRDVMNSWDSDTQNYLMIMPQSECAAVGLEQKDAPQEPPSHVMLNLNHSQKPGKWEKHWMVLREDGQVTASTKENDIFPTNALHLSDFDVYMPTRKQMKKLRPPKKICFAIKSQQRSIMFESTENFVHFFATNDKAVADRWYNAVQAWRSWYLVNVLGAGAVSKPAPEAVPAAAPAHSRALPRHSTSHSRNSIPYQLGTFQPLLGITADAFAYGEKPEPPKQPEPTVTISPKRSKTLVGHARNKSVADTKSTGLERHATTKRPTTSAQNKQLREESQDVPVALSSTDAAFTGKGLLARAFSVKKAQAEGTIAHFENTDNAFTGKGLLSTKPSMKRVANENLSPGIVENTNDAFTGAGLLGVQRSLTKKRSAVNARPGQPLVDLSANSEYVDGSLLKRVEGWEVATGQNLPTIDRSRGHEVVAKTGEICHAVPDCDQSIQQSITNIQRWVFMQISKSGRPSFIFTSRLIKQESEPIFWARLFLNHTKPFFDDPDGLLDPDSDQTSDRICISPIRAQRIEHLILSKPDINSTPSLLAEDFRSLRSVTFLQGTTITNNSDLKDIILGLKKENREHSLSACVQSAFQSSIRSSGRNTKCIEAFTALASRFEVNITVPCPLPTSMFRTISTTDGSTKHREFSTMFTPRYNWNQQSAHPEFANIYVRAHRFGFRPHKFDRQLHTSASFEELHRHLPVKEWEAGTNRSVLGVMVSKELEEQGIWADIPVEKCGEFCYHCDISAAPDISWADPH